MRLHFFKKTALFGFIFKCGLVLLASGLLCACLSKSVPELGDEAPAFELKALEGKPFRFDPSSGKIHVLYFWADWCPRCEDDFRLMDKLHRKWEKQSRGPRLLAIDVGQTEEHVRNFINRLKTSFPIYMDNDGKVARSFGVKGLPTYFITDRKGIVCHIILGWADEELLLEEINKIDQQSGLPHTAHASRNAGRGNR